MIGVQTCALPILRQYYEQGTHVVLVDTGNSYQGLCEMIRRKTNGADGVYFTYTEEKPISFNPFYTDDYVFDVEKKDSIKTLLLTLWKSEDDKVTKTESGELGSAVIAYHPIASCSIRSRQFTFTLKDQTNHLGLILESEGKLTDRKSTRLNSSHL